MSVVNSKARPECVSRRAEVRAIARDNGITISSIPGGYHLKGRAVDIFVRELEYVQDFDLGVKGNPSEVVERY